MSDWWQLNCERLYMSDGSDGSDGSDDNAAAWVCAHILGKTPESMYVRAWVLTLMRASILDIRLSFLYFVIFARLVADVCVVSAIFKNISYFFFWELLFFVRNRFQHFCDILPCFWWVECIVCLFSWVIYNTKGLLKAAFS